MAKDTRPMDLDRNVTFKGGFYYDDVLRNFRAGNLAQTARLDGEVRAENVSYIRKLKKCLQRSKFLEIRYDLARRVLMASKDVGDCSSINTIINVYASDMFNIQTSFTEQRKVILSYVDALRIFQMNHTEIFNTFDYEINNLNKRYERMAGMLDTFMTPRYGELINILKSSSERIDNYINKFMDDNNIYNTYTSLEYADIGEYMDSTSLILMEYLDNVAKNEYNQNIGYDEKMIEAEYKVYKTRRNSNSKEAAAAKSKEIIAILDDIADELCGKMEAAALEDVYPRDIINIPSEEDWNRLMARVESTSTGIACIIIKLIYRPASCKWTFLTSGFNNTMSCKFISLYDDKEAHDICEKFNMKSARSRYYIVKFDRSFVLDDRDKFINGIVGNIASEVVTSGPEVNPEWLEDAPKDKIKLMEDFLAFTVENLPNVIYPPKYILKELIISNKNFEGIMSSINHQYDNILLWHHKIDLYMIYRIVKTNEGYKIKLIGDNGTSYTLNKSNRSYVQYLFKESMMKRLTEQLEKERQRDMLFNDVQPYWDFVVKLNMARQKQPDFTLPEIINIQEEAERDAKYFSSSVYRYVSQFEIDTHGGIIPGSVAKSLEDYYYVLQRIIYKKYYLKSFRGVSEKWVDYNMKRMNAHYSHGNHIYVVCIFQHRPNYDQLFFYSTRPEKRIYGDKITVGGNMYTDNICEACVFTELSAAKKQLKELAKEGSYKINEEDRFGTDFFFMLKITNESRVNQKSDYNVDLGRAKGRIEYHLTHDTMENVYSLMFGETHEFHNLILPRIKYGFPKEAYIICIMNFNYMTTVVRFLTTNRTKTTVFTRELTNKKLMVVETENEANKIVAETITKYGLEDATVFAIKLY